jgi:predicted dehydrogenase
MHHDPHAPQPLQLGFIGGSVNSAVGYTHFAASALDRHWRLAAGCFSRQAAVNAESAATYGVEPGRVYASLQEMLDREANRLDAVAVLTPTPAHFEDVMACLRAGVPVICEKALASNRAEVEKILRTRDEYQGFLAVTYNYSGYPMLRELAARIARGALGRILHFTAEMPQEGFVRVDAQGNKPTPQSWRLTDRAVPTLHLDLAVHLHQTMHFLLQQKPLEVVSDQNHYGWFAGVVDNATCLCRYTGGIQGTLWFSKSALGHRNGLRIRIYGDQGSAEWFQANPEELLLSHVDGRREILDRASAVEVTQQRRYNRFKAGHPAGFIEAFANLYQDIARALRDYRQAGSWISDQVFSAELALEGMNLLEAMVASAQNRGWQSLGGPPAERESAPDMPALAIRRRRVGRR